MNNDAIKIMVVDDHPLVRKGIAMCLGHRKRMTIVGEVDDGLDVISKAQQLQPDVILMDISLPHLSGLTLTAELRKQLPTIKVIIISIHSTMEYVRLAIEVGARGYLFKGASTEDLLAAVEAVHHGETYFSSSVGRAAVEEFNSTAVNPRAQCLTGREREVLIRVAEGHSNKQIAGLLGISVRTVETHREHFMHKLGKHSTADVTRFAVAIGWVPLEGK